MKRYWSYISNLHLFVGWVLSIVALCTTGWYRPTDGNIVNTSGGKATVVLVSIGIFLNFWANVIFLLHYFVKSDRFLPRSSFTASFLGLGAAFFYVIGLVAVFSNVDANLAPGFSVGLEAVALYMTYTGAVMAHQGAGDDEISATTPSKISHQQP